MKCLHLHFISCSTPVTHEGLICRSQEVGGNGIQDWGMKSRGS